VAAFCGKAEDFFKPSPEAEFTPILK